MSKTYLDASEDSWWFYVRLLNGDTIVDNPLTVNVFEADSIVDDLRYTWFYEQISPDSQSVVFLQRLDDRIIYQTFYFEGDSSMVLHLPCIDLNRSLNDSWELNSSTVASRVLYIDSVGFDYKGQTDVFRVISEEYFMGTFAARSELYYQMQVGLLQRRSTDMLNNNEFVMDLVDFNVNIP